MTGELIVEQPPRLGAGLPVHHPQAPGVRVVCVSLGGSLRPAVRMAGPITRPQTREQPRRRHV
jgi:hypothetical protein